MTASDISVDENTLRIIGQVLTRLHQSDVPVSTEKLWTLGDRADVTKLSFNDVDSLGSVLNGTKYNFHQLEATKNALFLLARSCEQRLIALKAEMRPYFLHSGILSLPDDVLALIFENSLLERGNYTLAEQDISHVCRRFRSISLGLPKLWSHVDIDMAKKWVEIRLLRSRATGLAVDICDNQWNDAISRFGQLVVPHAHRWQSFRLLAAPLSTRYYIFNQRLTEHFANLKLPALTYFHIELEALMGDDAYFDDPEFYSSWEMPKLRHSNISHRIPPGAMRGSQTITSFAFKFIRGTFDFDFQNLMDLLSSLDNLTDLSLELIKYDDYDYVADLVDRVVLPKVESFTLKTRIFKALKVMTMFVQMPALTKLSLDVGDGDVFSAINWLDLVCMKEYSSVKDFTFVYRERRRPSFDLSTAFSKFPNMQRLVFDTPDIIEYYSRNYSFRPPLRSMSFSHTSANRLMEYLAWQFKHREIWNEFETPEITNNRLLVRKKIKEVV